MTFRSRSHISSVEPAHLKRNMQSIVLDHTRGRKKVEREADKAVALFSVSGAHKTAGYSSVSRPAQGS